MKLFKILLGIVFITALNFSAIGAGNGFWMKNLEQAQKIAAKKNLPVLVYFTGSDWCMWCIKFDKEVFSKQAIKDYLKDNFISVVVDFPMYQEQAAAVRQKNALLKNKYAVAGFPTLLVLSPKGDILAKSNYIPGGVEAVKKYLELAKQRMK